ncbi:MAG: PQQ-binding-like beta-propeller repeat protein [Planctomycetota bacterium]
MRFRLSVLTAICVSALWQSTPVIAEPWRQFRGSTGGSLDAIQHPTRWSDEQNLAWAVPLEGTGWSSPVVVGERIFLTSAVSDEPAKPKGMMAGVASMATYRSAKPKVYRFFVSCHSLRDGARLWKKSVGEMTPPVIHPSNTYATESPATDGQQLFTFFATSGALSAWDLDGNKLWQKDLGTYPAGNGFGTGSSLAVLDGRVFVQFDNDEQSFVAAFDTRSGEQLWRDDRSSKTSWSTPLVWNHATQSELVTCGAGVVTSYNPTDGSVLWQLTGMQSAFSGSPAIDADRIYFGNSGPMSAGPLVAVSAGTAGKVELDGKFKSDQIAWSRVKSGPGMASPVVAAGHLYIPGRGGILNCYDTATGERIYRERVDGMSTVVASLWADEQRVFLLDEKGATHVIQAGSEFKLLGTNLIDDLFWSTPTIAGETLLLRGVEKLYCIRP